MSSHTHRMEERDTLQSAGLKSIIIWCLKIYHDTVNVTGQTDEQTGGCRGPHRVTCICLIKNSPKKMRNCCLKHICSQCRVNQGPPVPDLLYRTVWRQNAAMIRRGQAGTLNTEQSRRGSEINTGNSRFKHTRVCRWVEDVCEYRWDFQCLKCKWWAAHLHRRVKKPFLNLNLGEQVLCASTWTQLKRSVSDRTLICNNSVWGLEIH